MSDQQKLACDQATCEQVAFIGQTLAPFFLYDPVRQAESVEPMYRAMAELDVDAAAAEWPFADAASVRPALGLMHDGLADGITDELMWEYRRLFVGPGKKAAAPWGSVYTDRECVVFGESTLALRAWMRERGIDFLGQKGEPEDHIGLMLMLMAWIATNRPELLEEYLRVHLFTWACHFLEGAEAAAEHEFFKGLAALSRESLAAIQDALGISVTYPRFFR